MNKNKKIIAMLLAGGQGSRLYALTSKIAKPAVPFGAKYRIIDFPLSNCINSGIDTVGVLTQYQPLVLNEYIGNGQPWDMDRTYGGVHILPPYQAKDRMDWYKGTANAIYQNIHFIQNYNPEYVIILSGDHIYQMNYDDMLSFHVKKHADVTIGVIEVPMNEASRFGIIDTDFDMKITEFAEKPKSPKSNKASMGIYIFNTKKLIDYLEQDEKNKKSNNDFGKNIIPTMLAADEKLFAFPFKGYWKDVGTISSLWEANMDLLGEKPEFDIHNLPRKIYSRNLGDPAHFIARGATVTNSVVAGGCEILGSVENSIIGTSVVVEEGAIIRDSIIMKNVTIGKGSKVFYSIIDEFVKIGNDVAIGEKKNENVEIAVVGRDLVIADRATISAGSMIENNLKEGEAV